MQGFSTLKKVFDNLLLTGIVSGVYHSVMIHDGKDSERFPVYPSGGEEKTYVGIDDTKEMTVYCRALEDMKVLKVEHIGGCSKMYKCSILHRLVFFNDYEKRNFDNLISKFLQCMFVSGVTLRTVISDKYKLVQLESNAGRFNFGNTTFYFAIDFEVSLNLVSTTCGIELGCDTLPNPYCLILPDSMFAKADFNEDFNMDYLIKT